MNPDPAANPPPLPPVPRSPAPLPMPRRPVNGNSAGLAAAIATLIVLVPLALAFYAVYKNEGFRRSFMNGFRQAIERRTGIRRFRSTGMLAVAREPIPRDPHATTAEADRQLLLAWARRTILGGYDKAGRHDPKWNTAARAFIERALPWWAGLHANSVTSVDLLPDARNVIRLGCDDPLVLYLAGLVEVRVDEQSAVSAPLFTRAVTGFQTTLYPRGVALVAASELYFDCLRRRDGTGQSKPVAQWWVKWFGEALRDGSFGPDEQVALAMLLNSGIRDDLFEKNRTECLAAVTAAGDQAVAPWLRLWLSGKCHVADAWDARSGNTADKVTQEGWRGFKVGLALAREDLSRSWHLAPQRPEGPTMMITVALGENAEGEDGPRAWFDRAVRAEVDYASAYKRMYFALLPQWGGSQEAVLAFGLTCAATADYTTGVPLQLNEAAKRMDAEDGYGNAEIYAALEKMYAGYEAEPTQVGRRVYFHVWHARGAALTGRYTQAFQLLKEVNFAQVPGMAADLKEYGSEEISSELVAAYGGPGGADAQAGDRLVGRGRNDAALEKFLAALAAGGREPHAAAYLQSRINMLQTEAQLKAGRWISFQPVAGAGGVPAGWTTKLGTWRVAADGVLIGEAGARGLMLVNEARVGPDFEVRGELDFLPGGPPPNEQQAGVLFGHPSMEGYDWQSFRLKRNGPDGSIATVSCHWQEGPKVPMAVLDHNVFLLQSLHGNISLTVNGVVLFHDAHLNEGAVTDGTGLVGLGGYAHHGHSFTVTYRKLHIRRLTGDPHTAAGEPAVPGAGGEARGKGGETVMRYAEGEIARIK